MEDENSLELRSEGAMARGVSVFIGFMAVTPSLMNLDKNIVYE